MFFLKILWFFELWQFCCSAGVLYRPAWCVRTHWHGEKTEKGQRVRNISKSSEKTQYLMNTLYLRNQRFCRCFKDSGNPFLYSLNRCWRTRILRRARQKIQKRFFKDYGITILKKVNCWFLRLKTIPLRRSLCVSFRMECTDAWELSLQKKTRNLKDL